MKNSFIFYRSFYEAIDLLPDDIQFQIYKAITKYSFKNETIELSGISQAIFTLIKPQLEANNKRYENGIKGGRPSTDKEIENQKETEVKPNNNQTETETKPNGNQTLTKAEPNVNENENVNLNENKKEEEKEKEKEKKEKNINIQKEKTFKSEIKAEPCEEKARMPEVQKIHKTENIQDMPQQVGLVVKSDQHKSVSEYSHNFQNSPEYAKYYKNFNQKKQYAEFVFMKTREYDELLIKYGDNVVSQAIEKLNNWKLEKLEKRCLKDIR
jgi:hypothetical protein